MSTATKFPIVPSDRFRYGWRPVRVVAADGTVAFDQIPLTLEDVLFPKTGDFIVQTDSHENDILYLKDVFKARLAGDRTAAVISDCRVDWNLPGVKPLGPDIAVFFGVKRYRDWATFDVAAEGAQPALVVEVTSPDTRQNDVGPKFAFYYQARLPVYLIADASQRGKHRHLDLIGYRYTRRGYRRIPLDENGRVFLEPVRLCVGVSRDRLAGYERLACFDPETGEEFGDYTAPAEARAAAEQQARTAKQEAQAAKRQTQAAKRQAQNERRRGEAMDQARAEEARARAAAEARVRELEAELKRSRRP